MSKPTGKLAFAYQTIASMEARIDALLAEREALRDALEDATHQIRSSLNLLKCDDEFIAKQLTKARAALQGAQS